MNQAISFLQKPFITIGAVFTDVSVNDALNGVAAEAHSGFAYTFKAEPKSGLKVGDLALVHANDELKVVRVVEIHDTPKIDPNANFQYKWVVQRIDLKPYRKRLKEERKLTQLLARLAFTEQQHGLLQRIKQAAKFDKRLVRLLKKVKQQM